MAYRHVYLLSFFTRKMGECNEPNQPGGWPYLIGSININPCSQQLHHRLQVSNFSRSSDQESAGILQQQLQIARDQSYAFQPWVMCALTPSQPPPANAISRVEGRAAFWPTLTPPEASIHP
jgi:hypothetical protein